MKRSWFAETLKWTGVNLALKGKRFFTHQIFKAKVAAVWWIVVSVGLLVLGLLLSKIGSAGAVQDMMAHIAQHSNDNIVFEAPITLQLGQFILALNSALSGLLLFFMGRRLITIIYGGAAASAVVTGTAREATDAIPFVNKFEFAGYTFDTANWSARMVLAVLACLQQVSLVAAIFPIHNSITSFLLLIGFVWFILYAALSIEGDGKWLQYYMYAMLGLAVMCVGLLLLSFIHPGLFQGITEQYIQFLNNYKDLRAHAGNNYWIEVLLFMGFAATLISLLGLVMQRTKESAIAFAASLMFLMFLVFLGVRTFQEFGITDSASMWVMFPWLLIAVAIILFVATTKTNAAWALIAVAVLIMLFSGTSISERNVLNRFDDYLVTMEPGGSRPRGQKIATQKLAIRQPSLTLENGVWTAVVPPNPEGVEISLGSGCHDLEFVANGLVDIGRGPVGPNGESRYRDTSMVSGFSDNVGGLVLYINDKYCFVGTSLRKRICGDSLTLLVNESENGARDGNSGAFEVKVKKL